MISADDVKDTVTEMLAGGEGEGVALQATATAVLETLKANGPTFYRNYGPYWWGLQSVLRNHAPRGYREWLETLGGEDVLGEDPEIKAAYDYGTDAMNAAAASMYLEQRAESMDMRDDNPHTIETPDGDVRQYIPGVGIIEDRDEE